PFMSQAALNYAIRKAGSTEELQTTYNNWMNGGHKPGDFGSRFTKSEKAGAFARGAEKHKGDHGDLPFRDPNNGFKITSDIGKQTRMISEANNLKGGFDFSKQRQSYWQGIGEVNENAQAIHQRVSNVAASRGTTAEQLYNTPEFAQEAGLIKEMQTFRKGLQDRTAMGAPISANEEHRSFMGNSS